MEEVLEYKLPTIDLLIKDNEAEKINIDEEKERIEKFFNSYNIDIDCKDVYKSINSVTYVIDTKMKNSVKTIEGFTPEIKMLFNAVDVNYEKAINGTTYLGIQMIYEKRENLILGNLIGSTEFVNTDKKIPLIIGTDLNGKNIIEDLALLPHLLIAGTTGVGKSILLSTFIVDILYKFNPDELKLVLIDTRKNNFLRFEGLPHLLTPIITDSEKSIRVISMLIEIMSERYKLFKVENVDNIDNYNEVAYVKLPRIVVIIEDFCDLMLDTSSEIEEHIVRLAQMSRAAGIHLIISTQRPSTNVVTGLIKSNLPARIAFNVPSQVDSKTIIDVANAEKLLAYGDILYRKPGVAKLKRIQTPYISDNEINDILNHIKENNSSIMSNMEMVLDIEEEAKEIYEEENEEDPLLEDAIEYIIEIGQVSASIIQRKFKVGYTRAGRIIDQMEERGIISPYQGSKPREVLINTKRCLEINNNCIEDNEEMENSDIEVGDNVVEDDSIDDIDEIEENEENIDENILKNKWFWIWLVIVIGIIIGMIG